ncbi:MAG: TrpB-like pyridoxal phosphate-dependent enzyme [Gammaproteobacteria bacterium]
MNKVDNIPTSWCNFLYDYPEFISKHKTVEDLQKNRKVNIAPKQPLSLMRQSINTQDEYIIIPEELLSFYQAYRPTPLRQAHRLQKKLDCNANIYYKFEGANVSGSHKLNTALAQVYYYKKAGVKHIVTGTGAGQWGTAIAYACQQFGLKCTIFMVNSSLRQKPMRKTFIELFGATIHESPSIHTNVGRQIISKNKNHPGSLAVATAEAIEMANEIEKAQFAVGSGENSVLLHQTIIGEEALLQLQDAGVFPDQVVACMGAGSNFAGIALPIHRYAKKNRLDCSLIAAEPIACPKLTRGKYSLEVNDFSGTTPISKMYTLGKKFTAPEIHAGGLRYHGTSEFLSAMYHQNLFSAMAVGQIQSLKAGLLFLECEGILPAPESAHAVSVAIENALKHPKDKKPLNILINISGHGNLDILAYEQCANGTITDCLPDEEMLSESLSDLMGS